MRNLYPWTNSVVPLIRTPKNKINTNLILMHPILTTRRLYLYEIVLHQHHLNRSVSMRVPTRRMHPLFQTATRLWTFGIWTTTPTERGAASVSLCDLVRAISLCFLFLGQKIFEHPRFSWSFLTLLIYEPTTLWSRSFFRYSSVLLSLFLYILTSLGPCFWLSPLRPSAHMILPFLTFTLACSLCIYQFLSSLQFLALLSALCWIVFYFIRVFPIVFTRIPLFRTSNLHLDSLIAIS